MTNFGNRSANILLVDAFAEERRRLREALPAPDFACVEVETGARAYHHVRCERPDAIVADERAGAIGGLALLDMLASLRQRPPLILTAQAPSPETVRHAFRRGVFDVVAKPYPATSLRGAVTAAVEAQWAEWSATPELAERTAFRPGLDPSAWQIQLRAETKRVQLETALALVAAVEAKEPGTRGHARSVSGYCVEVARRMGLPAAQIDSIRIAGLLHDVGKIGVPDALLQKPNRVTAEEYHVLKRHPQTAVDILRHASCLHDHLPVILHHHERFDGEGYPAGLKGKSIPLGARILAVCDAVDAMLSPRSYKPGFSMDYARSELRRCAGDQFDPQIARLAGDWMTANPQRFVRQSTAPVPVAAGCGVVEA